MSAVAELEEKLQGATMEEEEGASDASLALGDPSHGKRKAERLTTVAGGAPSAAADGEAVRYALSEVALCPRNAQCRLDLALELEKAGALRAAYAEAKAATTLTPKYGRAWKARARLEESLAAAQVPFDDDDGPHLATPLDAEGDVAGASSSSSSSSAAPVVTTDDEARALSAERKQAGNAHFVAQRHSDAVADWTAAIGVLKTRGLTVDAKLYSNRAAAYLALSRNVLAATDARLSAEADPAWWKAHWYLGQALGELLVTSASKRGACTSNGERAQEAYRAIAAAADAPTLPADKRAEVLAYKDKMQAKIYEMTDQGACVLQ